MKIRKLLWLIPLLLTGLVVIAIYEEFFASSNYQKIEISDYDSDPTLSREDKDTWTRNLRDEKWLVERSPKIDDFFYQPEQTTMVHPMISINPYVGLNDAGVTPMISTENGVALWANCQEIEVLTGIDFFLEQVEEMYNVIEGVTEVIKTYTGLRLTHSLQTTGNHPVYGPSLINTTEIPYPKKNSIHTIWVPRESPHLEYYELGRAEVWNTVETDGTPTITRARVILSEKLFDEYKLGLIGRGGNIETAVLHEFVHAVGVGHSNNKNSFMHIDLADESFITIADLAALIFAGSRSC